MAQWSLDFDGYDDFCDCGDVGTGGKAAITVECWVKFDHNGQQGIVSKWGTTATAQEWALFMDSDGYVRFRVSTAENVYCDSPICSTIATGAWYHIAGIFNGADKVRLYVNGLQISTGETVSGGTVYNTSQLVEFGRYAESNYLNGHLAYVRISDMERYTATFVTPNKPQMWDGNCLAQWDFVDAYKSVKVKNRGSSATTYDAYINGASWSYDIPTDKWADTSPAFGSGWTIYIEGADYTNYIDVDTLRITKNQNFRRNTAEFVIDNIDMSEVAALQAWQTVIIWHGGQVEFGGKIMVIERSDLGVSVDAKITCADWTALMDARITAGELTYAASTTGQLVVDLMTLYVSEISASLTTYGGGVYTGTASGAITYNYAIVNDCIRDLAQAESCTYYVKVENYYPYPPVLYFHAAATVAAPFALSTEPVTDTSFALAVVDWVAEGLAVRNKVTVQYSDGVVVQTDTASQTAYGYVLEMFREVDTTDATQASLVALGLLTAYSDELYAGTVRCWQDGLEPGMLVTIYHDSLSEDDDYLIQRVVIVPNGEKTVYQLTLGDKHAGLIDLLRQTSGGGGAVSSDPGTVGGGCMVGRREGPHFGLFKRERYGGGSWNVYAQAVDTSNQPFFSIGAVMDEINRAWISIGYPDEDTGKPAIRFAEYAAGGDVEQRPKLEIDADCLVGTVHSAVELSADSVDDTMIDWGTGSKQVSGVDVPLADVGGYFGTDNVEAALQQLGADTHVAVTLAADAGAILSLSTQEIGLDTQTANYVFAGPTSGAAADPTFRALVAADVPTRPGRTVTDTTTELAADANGLIVCNKGTAMTVNLLAATGSWRRLTVKNIGAGAVTVDGADAETIDGQTTQVLSQWDAMQMVDYAAGAWVIV